MDSEPCDHCWEHVDASFSHEFGTRVIRYDECSKCGVRREADDEVEPDYDVERPLTPLENWQRNDERNVR